MKRRLFPFLLLAVLTLTLAITPAAMAYVGEWAMSTGDQVRDNYRYATAGQSYAYGRIATSTAFDYFRAEAVTTDFNSPNILVRATAKLFDLNWVKRTESVSAIGTMGTATATTSDYYIWATGGHAQGFHESGFGPDIMYDRLTLISSADISRSNYRSATPDIAPEPGMPQFVQNNNLRGIQEKLRRLDARAGSVCIDSLDLMELLAGRVKGISDKEARQMMPYFMDFVRENQKIGDYMEIYWLDAAAGRAEVTLLKADQSVLSLVLARETDKTSGEVKWSPQSRSRITFVAPR